MLPELRIMRFVHNPDEPMDANDSSMKLVRMHFVLNTCLAS